MMLFGCYYLTVMMNLWIIVSQYLLMELWITISLYVLYLSLSFIRNIRAYLVLGVVVSDVNTSTYTIILNIITLDPQL